MPKSRNSERVLNSPARAEVHFDPATGVKTTRLHLDQDGYPGWWADVRVNPRLRDWDAITSADPEQFWQALGRIVRGWNFVADGEPMPLPSEGLMADDLPSDLLGPLALRYVRAAIAASAPREDADGL